MTRTLAGWTFTIWVPQPNGKVDHHVWIVAIPEEQRAREKLLLSTVPADVEATPLSLDQVLRFGLEPGQLRRVQ